MPQLPRQHDQLPTMVSPGVPRGDQPFAVIGILDHASSPPEQRFATEVPTRGALGLLRTDDASDRCRETPPPCGFSPELLPTCRRQ